MTDKEFLKKWQKLDADTKKELLQVMEQMLRAASLGLKVSLDAATNTVIAPPPMNIETVTAWLDDYEKEAAEE